MSEHCNSCGRKYDGSYPCPNCGSVNFVKDELKKGEKENE